MANANRWADRLLNIRYGYKGSKFHVLGPTIVNPKKVNITSHTQSAIDRAHVMVSNDLHDGKEIPDCTGAMSRKRKKGKKSNKSVREKHVKKNDSSKKRKRVKKEKNKVTKQKKGKKSSKETAKFGTVLDD